MALAADVGACPYCRTLQQLPPPREGEAWACCHCGAHLVSADDDTARRRLAGALALAGLILYPAAVTLPVLRLTTLGHAHETGILQGIWSLLAGGHLVLGVIVFVCSVVAPLAKIGALLTLTFSKRTFLARHERLVHRLLEMTGRWGMLDVFLVAMLVGAVKLGDMADVNAGSGAIVFAAVVVLGMLSSALYRPRRAPESAVAQ